MKLLYYLIIYLAVMDAIRSVPKTSRGSRKNRSWSFNSLGVRKGLSGKFHSRSPVQRRNNGDGGDPSSSSGHRNRSGSPDLEILPSAPSTLPRQGSNTTPDLQILSSTSIRRSPSRPFPYIEGTIGQSKNPSFLKIIEHFKRQHYEPGVSEMTSREFKTLKSNLLTIADENDKKCNTGDKEKRKKAGNQCALAVKEFQKISRNWRGPCEHVFIGWCQNWGTAGWKCSFFFKTSPSYNLPMPGYSYKMHDCINALSPKELERIENAVADEWIVDPSDLNKGA